MADQSGSRPASPAAPASVSAPNDALTLRALVSTKEAGVIIGKAGKNVAELRDQTGVKAGVSKVVPGVHERVLSVSGTVEGVAKAYSLIIGQLLDPESSSAPAGSIPQSHYILKLLISHNLMGTIIGRQGLKIKAIQDASGARMVASKEMLSQSTERVVEVQGTAEGIGRAVEEIGRCLLEDWERGLGTVLYHPGVEDRSNHKRNALSGDGRRRTNGGQSTGSARLNGAANGGTSTTTTTGQTTNTNATSAPTAATSPSSGAAAATPTSPAAGAAAPASNLRTQNISIPSDMVGCIIGRQGTKISEIRRLSGSKISIAKTPHDETGERMFTIVGTPEANEKALFLLYNQLESEKERRVGREAATE